MKKQIILTPILEFGGSNEYLKLLIEYFGKENVVLILDNKQELTNVKKIDPGEELTIKIFPDLQDYAIYQKGSFLVNFKVALHSICSIFKLFFLSVNNGFAGVTISAIEFEKHLYLLWLPFIKVNYVLHSTPVYTDNILTSFTCNNRLGKNKKIITVSNSNKNLIIKTWKITPTKQRFVCVIYNCVGGNKSRNEENPLNTESRVVIITMGHVTEYKNPFFWFEVAKVVVQERKNVLFYWLGNGSLLKDFQLKTEDIEEINFIGIIDDTASFLKTSKIYYQPSISETHGMAVIEAMSNKLPCVVSNRGGLPESVIHNFNGFVVAPDNLKENVDALVNLIDNEELRYLFGRESYKRYEQLFTYDVFKYEMDKIFLS